MEVSTHLLAVFLSLLFFFFLLASCSLQVSGRSNIKLTPNNKHITLVLLLLFV